MGFLSHHSPVTQQHNQLVSYATIKWFEGFELKMRNWSPRRMGISLLGIGNEYGKPNLG